MTADEFTNIVHKTCHAVEVELEGITMNLDELCRIMLISTAVLITNQTNGEIPYERALELVLNYHKRKDAGK